MTSRREIRSIYLEWAKLRSKARFGLAASDVHALSTSGDARSRRRICRFPLRAATATGLFWKSWQPKRGIPVESVVHAQGTSMANHLAMAALLEPGDEILIEEPGYEATFCGGAISWSQDSAISQEI